MLKNKLVLRGMFGYITVSTLDVVRYICLKPSVVCMLSHCILDVILYILFCYLTDIFIVPPGWNELSTIVTRSVHPSAMITSPGLDDEDIG